MHHCQYRQRLLYEPLQFCSTACAALFHQVRDPIARAAYQPSYPERKADRRAKRKARAKAGRRVAVDRALAGRGTRDAGH